MPDTTPTPLPGPAPDPTQHARSRGRLRLLIPTLGLLGLLILTGALALPTAAPHHTAHKRLLQALGPRWTTDLEFGLGPTTCWLTSGLLGLAIPDPEARPILKSIHGFRFAKGHLKGTPAPGQETRTLDNCRTALSKEGWSNIFTFSEPDRLIMVFSPNQPRSSARLEVCALIQNRHETFVVSGKSDPEQLLPLLHHDSRSFSSTLPGRKKYGQTNALLP